MGKRTRRNRNKKSSKTIKLLPCKEEVKVGFKSIENEYESSKFHSIANNGKCVPTSLHQLYPQY